MAHRRDSSVNFVALDVGTKRIGVALASRQARLAHPLMTLANDDNIWESLANICHNESVGLLVVGLPRGLDGQETGQTAYCRDFADQVAHRLRIPVDLQDEALTSKLAEDELRAKNVPASLGDVDALAATYILEDYLKEHN